MLSKSSEVYTLYDYFIYPEKSSHPWLQTDILLSKASQNVLLGIPKGATPAEPAPWLDFSDKGFVL
ncbi:hypothetical protein COT48_00710 [Candidatus Woesearchaeota archaeon CG08_land_8_20_14_0_20_47_9]|nr:MAG: hypothetical protein COT48_00710 [Candidatus Woesearchaeota archaeon CG08_land_8_20_14_0_20_47_9]